MQNATTQPSMIARLKRLARTVRMYQLMIGAWALVLVGGSLVPSQGVQAATSGACVGGGYTAVLSGGTTWSGDRKLELTNAQVQGKTLVLKGKYNEFTVDLGTLRLTNYTLTGVANPYDITGRQRTVLFASKTPEHGKVMNGNLSLELSREKLVLIRTGAGIKMKIQAKDCAQGGIFQMEAEQTTTMRHQLGTGFRYYTDALGRTLFTNGRVVGRESPETATQIFRDATSSRWNVIGGGRMGMVLGEDATQ